MRSSSLAALVALPLILQGSPFFIGCSSSSDEAPRRSTSEGPDDAEGVEDDTGATPRTASDAGGPTSLRKDASGVDAKAEADPLGGWQTADAASLAPTDGGLAVTTQSRAIGPLPIASGEETTVCITVRLDNDVAVYVPRITVDLAPGSHHLVTYRSMATSESATPQVCTGFAGILGGNAVPVMISQKQHDELTFPRGVALKLQPHQMIMLEAHYINPGTKTLQGHGEVHFDTIPVDTKDVVESDLAFWGSTAIVLGAHAKASLGPLFKPAIAGTHGFAVTTHQHQLGTRFRIWYAKSAQDVNHTPIADTLDWSNAPLYRVRPEMDFDGANGLAFQCEWENTTGSLVTFGESALQEMCFLWMYYYPSHGFDMRLN